VKRDESCNARWRCAHCENITWDFRAYAGWRTRRTGSPTRGKLGRGCDNATTDRCCTTRKGTRGCTEGARVSRGHEPHRAGLWPRVGLHAPRQAAARPRRARAAALRAEPVAPWPLRRGSHNAGGKRRERGDHSQGLLIGGHRGRGGLVLRLGAATPGLAWTRQGTKADQGR
jgi:hypothetical protein